ncbi:50S ribosomal protein L24 [Candidatus Woesearchaeota archaeon]|nr:50S ribosomal protein L24 [Candidatus Woesearchaeota archaeon]
MKPFSTAWKSSKDPGKQRKYQAMAPQHLCSTLVSAHLSKELRAQYKRRSLPVRTGDTVKVLRGSHKGKSGTVHRVDRKTLRIYVNGVTSTKRDGSAPLLPIQTSNVTIITLAVDKRRIEAKQ